MASADDLCVGTAVDDFRRGVCSGLMGDLFVMWELAVFVQEAGCWRREAVNRRAAELCRKSVPCRREMGTSWRQSGEVAG